MSITTHVLDTAMGQPASGVPIELEIREGEGWRKLGQGETDSDGRLRTLLAGEPQAGTYRLRFDTRGRSPFFPEVAIVFVIAKPGGNYHVPLLLSPFGYSTYRGS
jgi:5-hydroxyisourate hydrolase